MILVKEYYNFVLLGSFVHSFEFRADLIIQKENQIIENGNFFDLNFNIQNPRYQTELNNKGDAT